MPFDPDSMPAHNKEPEEFDPRPWLLFAANLAQAGEMDRAEAAFLDLLLRAPDFAIARFQLGLLQFTGARPVVAMNTWAPLDQLPANHYLRIFKQAFGCLASDQFEATAALLKDGMAQNQENPPLNRDMQMVLDRLQEAGLLPGPLGESRPDAGTDPGQTKGADSPAHFLLSSYRTPLN